MDSGIGHPVDRLAGCVRCKAQAGIALPEKGRDGRYRPSEGGVGLCWDCWEKETTRDNTLLNNLVRLGLERREGESDLEYGVRCKEYLFKHYSGLVKSMGIK